MTCCFEAKMDPEKRAGMCLACSLNCHENHEVIELYTKRNFRCDCGNPKFNHPCQFTADKTELNTENIYNQNFSGLYCVCNRPYPDPEATFEDEMIQCVVCEDWLHASHLQATVPGNDQYSDMICKMCMEKNDFLHDYSELVVNIEDREIEAVNGHVMNYPNLHGSEKIVNGVVSVNDIPKNVDMNVDAEKYENLNVSMNGNESEVEHNDTSKETQEDNINKTTNEMEDNDINGVDHSEQNDDTTKEEETKDEEISMETEQNISEKSETEVSAENENSNNIQLEANDESTQEISNNDMDITTIGMLEKPTPQELPNSEESENMVDKNETGNNDITESDASIITKLDSDLQTEDNKDITETEEKPPENENTDVLNSENNERKQEPSSTEKVCEDLPAEQNKELEGDTLERATEELSKLTSENSETEKISNADLNKDDKETVETEINDDTINQTTSNDNNENIVHINLQETTQPDNKRKLEEKSEMTAKKPRLDGCTRPRSKKLYKGATFWPANFRQKLCTCSECLAMYKDLSVMFLIDPEDTMTAYEALGKERLRGTPTSQYEKGLEALSSLDRVQQINALTEYNKMKDKLLDYLKSFKERKEIVKEEDIRAFFADMKPRREPDGVYFCR